jgi:hypothetical protein
MKRSYFILWYRLTKKNRYIIWYSDEEEGVLVDNNNKIPVFKKIKKLKQFAVQENIKIEDGKPILHNLDAVRIWLNKGTKGDINCKKILAAWNLFIDVATSLQIDAKKLQAYSGKSNKVYKKIFWGNNLPVVTPSRKKYIPIWNSKEIRLIKKIIRFGFSIFFDHIYLVE